MAQYKITKKRLAEIIKEEYESVLEEEAARSLTSWILIKTATRKSRWKMPLKIKKKKRATKKTTRRRTLARFPRNFASR